MPRKFWPTNSVMREGPVKGWGRGTDLVVAISLIRSAQPSKARSSDRTRVLSQSRRMVVIWGGGGLATVRMGGGWGKRIPFGKTF